MSCDVRVEPKFYEDQIFIPAPVVDMGVQAAKAVPEALELGSRSFDPDHPGYKWLHKHHILVQESGQTMT